ncbi:MAG: hypothetical protein ACE5E5_04335 [Phycisphaerae bacterium]
MVDLMVAASTAALIGAVGAGIASGRFIGRRADHANPHPSTVDSQSFNHQNPQLSTFDLRP